MLLMLCLLNRLLTQHDYEKSHFYKKNKKTTLIFIYLFLDMYQYVPEFSHSDIQQVFGIQWHPLDPNT